MLREGVGGVYRMPDFSELIDKYGSGYDYGIVLIAKFVSGSKDASALKPKLSSPLRFSIAVFPI